MTFPASTLRQFLADLLAPGFGNCDRTCGGYGTKGGVCCRKGFVLMFGECGERDAVLFRCDLDLVVGLRVKEKACQNKITIHMEGKAESLNASVAAAILMWEMMK